MDILIGVVLFLFIINQNTRIRKLEELLKGSPKNIGAQPLIPNIPGGAPLASVQPQVSQIKVPQQKDISTEEASGRILGRIGIAAVIIGVAFFLKYAFDNNWVGPAGRVGIGIIIGGVLIAVGQMLRKKYLRYSDLLMGGGLAILYLSIFSSYALYNLVDPMVAFFGLILVTAFGVILSVTNATKTLSYVALSGGYLAPVLIGVSNLGEFVTFTYITILNLGVLGVLLYKRWNHLILFGLGGTWLLFSAWFLSSYTEKLLMLLTLLREFFG